MYLSQEFQTHITRQEREVEIQHLRQQLARLEADRYTVDREIFAVKNFSPVGLAKIKRTKIFL